jgi:NAD(P)-dependent dehydrogenase (short-subunit alcohol dehydrogenase family)
MNLDRFSLDDRTALVTGASRGIGEAIAVGLGEAGADVVGLARSTDDLEATADRVRDTGARALPITADVTSEEEIAAAYDHAEAELGPVDVLVNNAGTNPYFGSTQKLDVETWEKIFAVNATGMFKCTKTFATRVFDRDGDGAVVNVGSAGSVVALPYQAPYTASKHAVAGFTKAVGVEWAPTIRVNAVAPGYVKTEFTKGVRENEDIYEELLDDIPIDRFAEPEDVAPTVVYLASDAASYAVGEVHVVDGGLAVT